MTKINLVLAVLLWQSFTLCGQDITQTIRGAILDEDTQLPLIGATITRLNVSPITGTITDENGVFRLEGIPVGRTTIKISYLGYKDRILPNIEVNSAKEVILDVNLEEAPISMETVVVKASQNKGDALNELAIISARSVSVEQSARYAGGFNDPSKITGNFAGVGTSQDGGNEIIVRGNSPKYVQWRLEGAQITNPNHFADPNAISGIVSSLNNNLLATSDFYTGAFPAEFGDALSGVYDVRMRKGNNEKFEGIFGLGILGTEVTLEGPFKKDYRGSYLVNYRYSTLGLASDVGIVDLEGNIKFQDGAFKIWLPTKRCGIFSLFALAGKSSFLFEDIKPSTWVTPGEDFIQSELTEDYEKAAHLWNTGINHTINLNDKSYLKSIFLFSSEGIKDKVFNNLIKQDSSIQPQLDFNSTVLKSTFRLNSTYHYKINPVHKFNVGFRYALFQQEMNQSLLNPAELRTSILDFDENIGTLSSFVNWKYTPNERIKLILGLHNKNVLFNNKSTLEPRLAINYKLSPSSSLSFGYGNHSNMESIHNYFAKAPKTDGTFTTPNKDLGLLRANHLVLGYTHYFNEKLRLKLETYYQKLYNLPVENSTNSSYATLNEGLELNYVDLVNEGTGKNYGVELTFERFLNKGYYFMFNASLYESKYTALDGIERHTKFNGRYLLNALAGKEFSNLGKKNNRIFAINTKVFLGGGRPVIPLLRDAAGDLAVDVAQGVIYDYNKAYENRLDNLVSATLNVSYKWNKAKTTHELFLNIDNITNNTARMTEYYDLTEPNNIGYQRQEGLIPYLLYRIYF